MARIHYYLFTLSPFNYLASTRLEAVAERHGADIEYKPFDLIKVFKETGTPPLAERPDSRKAYRLQELERIAKFHKMPINLRPAHWPTNPVPSCCAIISAQMAGGGDLGGLTHALMRACWAEEKDIAEDHVIRECLVANGYDAGLADRDMLSAVEIYQKNTNDALGANIFGAPSYALDHHVFWGQDRLDYLDAHLATVG